MQRSQETATRCLDDKNSLISGERDEAVLVYVGVETRGQRETCLVRQAL